ncbi:MAG: hypothetical protein WD768_05895 [Phycisphaeraceae bacterium]
MRYGVSRDADLLPALRNSLAVYRMVFGQPRQDDLVEFLLRQIPRDMLETRLGQLRIDLTPPALVSLFVIFGEPDIQMLDAGEEGVQGQMRVKINGVDVFHPSTGEVRSDGAEGIACWFIDTDYNDESFFVRHAYFLGASDPYKALKTTLKAEINEEAWATLNSDTSRTFDKPAGGKIAVKVINHLGDEVMKVFRVE